MSHQAPTTIAILLACASAAHADPEVIATQPLALVAHGVAVQLERPASPRLSWVALGGFRLGAVGDYDSSTVGVGGELRFWPRRSTEMRGPYVGAHFSVGRTTMSDQMGTIGASDGFTERVDVGWRWVIKHTVSLTPSLGIGTIEDVDETGRLATTSRATFSLGLEVGWFRERR